MTVTVASVWQFVPGMRVDTDLGAPGEHLAVGGRWKRSRPLLRRQPPALEPLRRTEILGQDLSRYGLRVPTIEFEERDLEAVVPDVAAGGGWTQTLLRWRRDPLTGASARLLTGVKLQPPTRPDLANLTAKPSFCPFDAEHLEAATFPFPAELTPEGRIRQGKAVVVPNLIAYATHTAVGIYDTQRHFLDLDELSPVLVGDALAAIVRHALAVRRLDPTAVWSSINANYLPPSGASLVHPHLQSAHDAHGLTAQRFLVERARAWGGERDSYWARLVEQESGGPRWVGNTGPVAWLTPFAPAGFHEVWGILDGRADVTELTEDDCLSFGDGLSRILGVYKSWNLASFNFAVIGGGPDGRRLGHRVLLKAVSRSNPEPMYRSDATYFERLYGEALIDRSPEEVAEGLRPTF
jgi:galactose-1-phosphate uridylyltransferase